MTLLVKVYLDIRICMGVFHVFAVLERDKEESVGIDELDVIQTELEILLASVAKRMRQLEGEINTLNSWQDKTKDKKGSIGKVVSPISVNVSHFWKTFFVKLVKIVNTCICVKVNVRSYIS